MEKMIIDERTAWEYELIGEQYYPTGRVMYNGILTPENIDDEPKGKTEPIGIWEQRHLRYIQQNKKSLYFNLYISGKWNAYIADVNSQAENMFFRLVKEMAAREVMTEVLKAENQMAWVQHSSNIFERAREVVNHDLIFQ